VYIGTPEERAAMDKADLSSANGDSLAEAHIGTNVLNYAPGATSIPSEWVKLGGLHHSFTTRRTEILGNIKTLREQVQEALSEDEKEAMQEALKYEIKALKELNEEQAQAVEDSSTEGGTGRRGDSDLDGFDMLSDTMSA
jgi:hypothetical protein